MSDRLAPHQRSLARSRALLAFIRQFPLVHGQPNTRAIALVGKLRGRWSKTTRTGDIARALDRIWKLRRYYDSAYADSNYRTAGRVPTLLALALLLPLAARAQTVAPISTNHTVTVLSVQRYETVVSNCAAMDVVQLQVVVGGVTNTVWAHGPETRFSVTNTAAKTPVAFFDSSRALAAAKTRQPGWTAPPTPPPPLPGAPLAYPAKP